MIFSKSAYDERAARAKEIAASWPPTDVRFIEMQFPDMNGMMRGKYTPLAKGLSAGGTGVSCLLYSARGGDNLTIDFWADFDNGFPKVVGLPDYDTVDALPVAARHRRGAVSTSTWRTARRVRWTRARSSRV